MFNIGRLAVLAVVLALGTLAASSQDGGYDQPYRPQAHFSPRRNWTNDPNGLVYFRGEYHLFYQYNPFGDEWGHMSWGHAVSKDLLHWQELPVAIPENDGVMIFTGSVVVDRNNSSGFCKAGDECLVAVYTGAGDTSEGLRQTQNIAYSLDRGRTWSRYAGNPVLDLHMADFRDPSVSWNEQARSWMMAVSLPKERKVRFYSSPNLKDWTKMSDFGPAGDVDGDWECPDLLQIPSADGTASIWALKVGLNPGAPQGGSGEQYFLGSFDGKAFLPAKDRGSHGWTNYGKDDYCAIGFNGLPHGQSPILIGWMSNWQYAAKLPTAPWRGQMSLPRRLSFVKDSAGLALRQEPIVEPLRGKAISLASLMPSSSHGGLGKEAAVPYEADFHFSKGAAAVFGVRLYSDERHWTEIGFDTAKGEFYMDRTNSGADVDAHFPAKTTAPIAGERPYDLMLIVDRSSVEAFAQNGTIAMTNLIYPLASKSSIQVFPDDPKTPPPYAEVWELKSVWAQSH